MKIKLWHILVVMLVTFVLHVVALIGIAEKIGG